MTKNFKIYFLSALVLAGLTAYFNPQPVATHVTVHSELSVAQLPPEAQKVWQRIQTNGPFAYLKKDGEFFGNFEKKLPTKPKGYYRSYTVPTKGLNHRGPKRLVAGGRSKTKPEVLYYTTDHYKSFVVVNF
jgi:ribonuclease T1